MEHAAQGLSPLGTEIKKENRWLHLWSPCVGTRTTRFLLRVNDETFIEHRLSVWYVQSQCLLSQSDKEDVTRCNQSSVVLWLFASPGKFPFRKWSMAFSRHLEHFSPVRNIFSIRKGNMQLITYNWTRNPLHTLQDPSFTTTPLLWSGKPTTSLITVEPAINGHNRDQKKWPFKRGVRLWLVKNVVFVCGWDQD